MPTLPSAGTPPPADEPHRHRQVAESFGVHAERYDRTRPSYPDALVRRVVAASPGPDVLDVGCGTGTAARQFRAAGCTLLGVEPDPRMAGFARRGGLEVEVATFESWDPAGRSFDAVIAGTAWHWVDPVLGAAKAAQLLRPGGRLALFWNVGQLPADAIDCFGAVYREVLPDSPGTRLYHPGASALDLYSAILGTAADGIRGTAAFGEPERWRFDWQQPYSRQQWLDLLPTQGLHTQLPPATLAALLAGIGAAVDAIGGGFTMQYAAMVVTAARLGGAAEPPSAGR